MDSKIKKIILKIKDCNIEEMNSFKDIKKTIKEALEKHNEAILNSKKYQKELSNILELNNIDRNFVDFKNEYNAIESSIPIYISKEDYIKLLKQIDILNKIALG